MIAINTSSTVTSNQIADAFVTAIEGGSNYWCDSAILTSTPVTSTSPWYADPKVFENPFVIVITPGEDDDPVTITNESLQPALQKLADDYPTYFRDLTGDESLDADGADVLFQLICFGEVVYG